jgi:hypothetical protein
LQLFPLPASDHAAFQADDEGSIPFTRSNVFKQLGEERHSQKSGG